MPTLLEVKNLETRFKTHDGWVYAVNGISYTLDEGETLGVVGESGCGKSVSMLSIMGLIPQPPGLIAGGQALYQGSDLLKQSDDELRRIRGKEIAMIFQDPMTSLNPVLTIGFQISEALQRRNVVNSLKYIDPSYIIRSAPANPNDSLFCTNLAHHAVHAGMSGRTGMIVGLWNNHFTHVPTRAATEGRKVIDPEGELWLSVLESTGQPASWV